MKKRWAKWRALSFPADGLEVVVEGVVVDLASIDSAAAGCIETWLSETYLSPSTAKVLKTCVEELRRAQPELPEPARSYFRELAELSELVLRSTQS